MAFFAFFLLRVKLKAYEFKWQVAKKIKEPKEFLATYPGSTFPVVGRITTRSLCRVNDCITLIVDGKKVGGKKAFRVVTTDRTEKRSIALGLVV